MIFQPVVGHGHDVPNPYKVAIYEQLFKFANTDCNGGAIQEPGSKMYLLERHLRGDSLRMGDTIPLKDVRQAIDPAPCFGRVADCALTADNCLEVGKKFWLNHFATKDCYHSLIEYF